MTKAKAINDKEDASQEEIDNILTALITAKDSLVVSPEEFLATSVVIDNHNNARPQTGLNDAKFVYETSVAPGITRFLTVFDLNNTTNEIGPIRSAKGHLVHLAANHKGSFVHAGGSTASLNLVPFMPFLDFDEIYNPGECFYRTSGWAPYNLLTVIIKST